MALLKCRSPALSRGLQISVPLRKSRAQLGKCLDLENGILMERTDEKGTRRALPAQPNNSLIIGIECLQQVVGAGGPLGSREIARRMNMTHTRINRLLGTLSYMGLLDQDGDRRYRPGPGLHSLAAQSMLASRLLPSALPRLIELSREGLTVALGTMWRGQVCFLFHERPGQALEDAILRHELWPASHSTIGVALLASRSGDSGKSRDSGEALDDEHSDELLPGQSLGETVARARERGYAVLRFQDGSVSVGVTIGIPPIAAIAVSSRHFSSEVIPEMAARLRDTAAAIDEQVRQASG